MDKTLLEKHLENPVQCIRLIAPAMLQLHQGVDDVNSKPLWV